MIAFITALHVTAQSAFTGVSDIFTADSRFPVVSNVTPNGGESFYFGQPLTVGWNASDESLGSTPVDVFVSLDGGTNYNALETGLINDGSESLTPPQQINYQVKVKVTVTDEFGLSTSAESNSSFSLLGHYLSMKVLLEGPYNGSGMSTHLNSMGMLPLTQPYFDLPADYDGDEAVSSIPDPDIVDWVLVELRNAGSSPDANPATMIHRQAAFLTGDGDIVGLDGSSMLRFGIEVTQNLYAVIYHRNHTPVISANPMDFAGNTYDYDFTTGPDQALGGANAHKELAAGLWGLFAGDGDGDGDVHNGDKLDVWNEQSGTSGYHGADFNMDSEVNNTDKINYWDPNSGRSSQVPG